VDKKKTEILLDLAEQNEGYVSSASAASFGIAQTYLSEVKDSGLFVKVSKGLYLKRGFERDPFFELSFRYKKVVFGLRSALYLRGLTDEPILEVNLPLNYLTQGIEGVRARHVGEKEYGLGQTLAVTKQGNLVMTYSLERIMIDLLRRNGEFAKDEFVSLWLAAKNKNPYHDSLLSLAEAFHVEGEFALMDRLY